MSSRTWQLPEATHAWLMEHVLHEPEALAALRRETVAEVGPAKMQISPEQGRFMAWLVQTLGIRRAVEVGTFTGYSALAVALAMPDDGHLVCCDVSEEWTAMGRRHWQAAGVGDRIDLRIAPALDTLDGLLAEGQGGTFDLVFVDADKGNYGAYAERAWDLLRPGGVLAIDNSLWSGKVADPSEQDPSTVAIREVVLALSRDPRWTTSMLPIGDGLLLATRGASAGSAGT